MVQPVGEGLEACFDRRRIGENLTHRFAVRSFEHPDGSQRIGDEGAFVFEIESYGGRQCGQLRGEVSGETKIRLPELGFQVPAGSDR